MKIILDPKRKATTKWWNKSLPRLVQSNVSKIVVIAVSLDPNNEEGFEGIPVDSMKDRHKYSIGVFTEYTGAVILQNET